MALRLASHTYLARHRRHRCEACKRRRVVFSLVSESPGGAGRAESPRLCGECAGLTGAGIEPLSMDDVIAEAELGQVTGLIAAAPDPRTLVTELEAAGFHDIAYSLAGELDASDAINESIAEA